MCGIRNKEDLDYYDYLIIKEIFDDSRCNLSLYLKEQQLIYELYDRKVEYQNIMIINLLWTL